MTPQFRGFFGCIETVLCGIVCTPAAFSGERYTVDGEQSFVRIAVKMCEPDLLKGEFGNISGEILLGEENVAKIPPLEIRRLRIDQRRRPGHTARQPKTEEKSRVT